MIVFMMVLGIGTISFSCNQTNKESMEHVTSHKDHANEFACSMHPEVTGKEGDKCSTCGMTLEKVNAEGKVSMSLRTHPEQVEAGKAIELSLDPRDGSDSATTVELEETHEKMIHVIVVNEDLSWFDHIHAEPSRNGAYTVRETFPTGGKYLVYADYKPLGRANQTDRLTLNVNGAPVKAVPHHESKLMANSDGYSLSIVNTKRLETGRVAMAILVEKDGKKLKRSDLENYLGAVAHIILISQDEKDFIHIHPESTDEYPILAHADIPKPGIYRMWVQFQTNGSVHTADFTLDVEQGSDHGSQEHAHAHAGHKH